MDVLVPHPSLLGWAGWLLSYECERQKQWGEVVPGHQCAPCQVGTALPVPIWVPMLSPALPAVWGQGTPAGTALSPHPTLTPAAVVTLRPDCRTKIPGCAGLCGDWGRCVYSLVSLSLGVGDSLFLQLRNRRVPLHLTLAVTASVQFMQQ